ncbi:hypothetical protein BHM03_00012354 [Ensete ventricosum]|nr:hypothetical protein BHM03_00012354 [Ensete ventricosum]
MSWSRCQAQFDLSEQDRPHRVVSIGLVDPLLLLRTCSCTKAEDFAEGIEKIARNTPGDHLKKAVILATWECRRLPNCRRLNPTGVLSYLHQHLRDSQRQKEVQGKVRVMEDELLKLS